MALFGPRATWVFNCLVLYFRVNLDNLDIPGTLSFNVLLSVSLNNGQAKKTWNDLTKQLPPHEETYTYNLHTWPLGSAYIFDFKGSLR